MSTRPGTPTKWPKLPKDAATGSPAQCVTARQAGIRHRTIPPEDRLTVNGYNRHCPTCWRFVRRGGGCPGVTSTSAMEPICHEAGNRQQATGNRQEATGNR